MPRIRTVKPEFWRSPDTAAASAVARLLYIAMWNWADDTGTGECDLKALEGFAFPNDDVKELSSGTSDNFISVLNEVRECFGVKFFEVNGKPYFNIPSWLQHQRNERFAKSKYPSVEDGLTWDFMAEPVPGKTLRRKSAELPTTSFTGTGEQGNSSSSTSKDEAAPAPTTSTTTKAVAKKPEPDGFEEFWKVYPRRQGKGDARKAFEKALKKTDLPTLIEAAARYADDPNREPKFTAMGATWLNQERWEDDPLPPNSTSSTSSFKRQSMSEVVSLTLEAGARQVANAQSELDLAALTAPTQTLTTYYPEGKEPF